MRPITVKYDNGVRSGSLVLRNKITAIMDNSGTGKSTLVQDLRRDLVDIEVPLGFELIPLPDVITASRGYVTYINIFKDLTPSNKTPIFYVDEDANYLHLRSFQQAVNEFPALFVFINRDEFKCISYSCQAINRIVYEKQPTGRYVTHLEKIYPNWNEVPENIDTLIYLYSEDETSGKPLYEKFGMFKIGCAGGKSKVLKILTRSSNTLFVVDEIGFGSEIRSVWNEIYYHPQNNNALLMIPSFEGMLLKSKFLRQDAELYRQACAKALAEWPKTNPNGALHVVSNYEDLCTAFLKELLRLYDIPKNWKKGNMPKCLLDDCCWRPKECVWKMDGNKCELLLDKVLCDCLKRIKANRIRNQIPDSIEGAADTTLMFQKENGLLTSKQ